MNVLLSILKIIFAVMLFFDVGYMFLYFGSELWDTIKHKIRRKKNAAPVIGEYEIEESDDEDDDEDNSYAPPLCIDSIYMVHRHNVRAFITDRIFPLSKEITAQLSGDDKEQIILLLSAFFMYLHNEAPHYEQNFTMVMELLNASTITYDHEWRDPVDKLLDDSLSHNRQTPDYYLDYQKYRISCKNKAHVLSVCKVLILTALKKLYGEWYSPSYELCHSKSVNDLLCGAKWEVLDTETEDE